MNLEKKFPEIKIPKGELIFEVIDQNESGRVVESTGEQVKWAEIDFLPSEQKAAMSVFDEKGEFLHFENVDVRYVPGDSSILLENQKNRNVIFQRGKTENKLFFSKGLMVVGDEPGNRLLREFLFRNYQFSEAPARPESLEPMYRILDLSKKAEEMADDFEEYAAALAKVSTLRVKKGGDYIYNTDRLNAYARVLGLEGYQTPGQTLTAIFGRAQENPELFLKVTESLDNTSSLEAEEAIGLGVIKIENGVVLFSDTENIILRLSDDDLKKEEAIQEIADYLITKEASEHLTDIRTKVRIKKDENLKNQ